MDTNKKINKLPLEEGLKFGEKLIDVLYDRGCVEDMK